MLLMGFSSGLPLLLTSRTLQLWLSYSGGSNALVGYVAIIGLPYTLKFVWAPLMDRYAIPKLGRRRGWMFVTQALTMLSIFALSRIDPLANLTLAAASAFMIAFASASQDIVIDAYRREILTDEELGLGSSLSTTGYRIAMWVAGGLAVIMSKFLGWNTIYLLLSLFMGVGLITTFFAPEPDIHKSRPHSLKDAVWLPLKDFFERPRVLVILAFILLYRVGDSMVGNMLSKLYVTLGFTPEEIGVVAKSLTPFSFGFGAFIGGAAILRLGIMRSLFIFGIYQALTSLLFTVLHLSGHNIVIFGLVVFSEDLANGMTSAALLAYMASLTNKSFTATQYALLTSLMAVPRIFIASMAGHLVDFFGWDNFFIFCTMAATPGLLLLYYLYKRHNPQTDILKAKA